MVHFAQKQVKARVATWEPAAYFLPLLPLVSPEPRRCRGELRGETLLCIATRAESCRARLASYGRRLFGAKVPDGEYDFGCCEELLGGELT